MITHVVSYHILAPLWKYVRYSFRIPAISLVVMIFPMLFFSIANVSLLAFFSIRRCWRSSLTAFLRTFFSSFDSPFGRVTVTRAAERTLRKEVWEGFGSSRRPSSSPESACISGVGVAISTIEGRPVFLSNATFFVGGFCFKRKRRGWFSKLE